jgi:hypothetical protein
MTRGTEMTARTDMKDIHEIPNVGLATARDLALINIFKPSDLIGKNPFQMYNTLCQIKGKKHDPCVIDVFISAVRFMEGEPSRKWWYYTAERKKNSAQVWP